MAMVKKKRLADGVIEEIVRRIDGGELEDGDKLPNQNEFAAELGVSRSSLREALHTLTLVGAIEQRPGLGTVIRTKKSARMAEHLATPLVSDAEASMELMETRRYIELAAVDLAAKRASEEDLAEMEKLIREMQVALDNERPEEYAELDLAFHYQIAYAAHNRFLIHLFVTMRTLMEQFIRETFTVLPGLLQRSLVFHAHILENMRARNRIKAVAAMGRHLEDIEKALEIHYST